MTGEAHRTRADPWSDIPERAAAGSPGAAEAAPGRPCLFRGHARPCQWQTKIQQFWREFVAPGSVLGCWTRWSGMTGRDCRCPPDFTVLHDRPDIRDASGLSAKPRRRLVPSGLEPGSPPARGTGRKSASPSSAMLFRDRRPWATAHGWLSLRPLSPPGRATRASAVPAPTISSWAVPTHDCGIVHGRGSGTEGFHPGHPSCVRGRTG